MTSTCSQSAAPSTARASSASREKSAARMDGAITASRVTAPLYCVDLATGPAPVFRPGTAGIGGLWATISDMDVVDAIIADHVRFESLLRALRRRDPDTTHRLTARRELADLLVAH